MKTHFNDLSPDRDAILVTAVGTTQLWSIRAEQGPEGRNAAIPDVGKADHEGSEAAAEGTDPLGLLERWANQNTDGTQPLLKGPSTSHDHTAQPTGSTDQTPEPPFRAPRFLYYYAAD